MSVNIEVNTTQVALSTGVKKFYTIDVFDEKTGQTKSSFSTSNMQEASDNLESVKQLYSTSKVNGVQGADPLSDGTIQQDNYDLGVAFAGINNEISKMSSDTLGYGSFEPDGADTPQPGQLQNRRPNPVLNTSKTFKRARDLSGMSPLRRELYGEGVLTEEQRVEAGISGVFGTRREQARVMRKMVASETIPALRGPDNNAFIVIGNDRVSKPHTGYGGKGHTQCDAIDIVAGMGGSNPKEVEATPGAPVPGYDAVHNKIETNPNFFVDAARIYVSQKTDVDKNFGIGEFGKTENSNRDNKDDKNIGKFGAKSAIAIKADNIRLIGRESIRIVTGTDKFNSQGGEVLSKSGVEIVAMNDVSTLQPMVLGDNLEAALNNMANYIQSLTEIFHAYVKYQMKFNHEVGKHKHKGFFYTREGLKSMEVTAANIQCDVEQVSKTELSVLKQITNLQGFKSNFLFPSGDSYINSRLNKVN